MQLAIGGKAMIMQVTKEEFDRAYLLPPREAAELYDRLRAERPRFAEGFVRRWWWWARCRRDVLVVTDGDLNFGMGAAGLSQFLTTFNALEAQSWIDYRVTTAHRTTSPASNNPVVVQHINDFKFDATNLADFDEIWLFGIDAGAALSGPELVDIEKFMDGGGGLFATGDHATLGRAMCGSIPRVKDMRYWGDFGNGEVSMAGARRNDTNQPAQGASTSLWFDNQSDSVPQPIAARTFGGGAPHPLLSISPNLRPSQVIDVMPDHPHEGECQPETSFTVNGVTVPTQHIATSFVRSGSTIGGGNGKTPTEPHCFPSIAVWDGWKANAGRIVVDSTWHHFVNINLNGAGSAQPGLDPSDWLAVRQYFMNIATWMSRRAVWWCWWRRLVFELVFEGQLVEASIEAGLAGPRKAPLTDLRSIGSLAEELLSARFNPGYARDFVLGLVADGVSENLATLLEVWRPQLSREEEASVPSWLDLDYLMHTAIGGGFAAVRANHVGEEDIEEEDLESIPEVFRSGLEVGFQRGLDQLTRSLGQVLERIGE